MKHALCIPIAAAALAAAAIPAAGQESTARGSASSVCVVVDDARDMLSPQDRRAALLLLTRQFEIEGRQVGEADCAEQYSVSHVQLGNTITVRLKGPAGEREGRAVGTDDLPALYSQLVRAILTGSSVGAMNVLDRSNVTESQAAAKRVQIDSFGYARLGYGAVAGAGGSGSPALGFGYRAEMDSFGLDVSFLNQQLPSGGVYGTRTGAMAASLLRIEGLYFTRPKANASAYFGGGLSWGTTSLPSTSSAASYASGAGSGLQGELTAGYELPRASALRVFVQADATLPFYRVAQQTITYSGYSSRAVVTGHRYMPALTVSLGMGWHRRRD